MIVDLNSFIGNWNTHAVEGQPDRVWEELRSYGVERIFASSLESAWCRNPHRLNEPLYREAQKTADVWPVPVLDPTVATWEKEVERALQEERVRLVRLIPNYSSYQLVDVDGFLNVISCAGLGVIVQVCLEDPRRQHPLAQVPNVPVSEVAEVAERHSGLTVIVGGAKSAEIRGLKERLLNLPNLYADVSQADGMDALKVLVEDGLKDKLVFGSHAPLFMLHSAFARILTDLDDASAEAILGGNALRILA
ncbi:MAG: amidohydrolase family protein [bacterium]|nr:amidohydrolase family protein [bacterium]